MSAPGQPPPPPHEPHLLKFRLRQLMLVVTLVGVVCTLVVSTEGPWPMIVIVTSLIVSGHVVGNLIGTRLRDTSREVVRWRAADPRYTGDRPYTTPLPCPRSSLPEETNLAEFRGSIRWLWLFLVVGTVLGAVAGGSLIHATLGHRISAAGWVVGTISCAVLGTWLAFLAVSFTTIARDALRQAHGYERRSRKIGR